MRRKNQKILTMVVLAIIGVIVQRFAPELEAPKQAPVRIQRGIAPPSATSDTTSSRNERRVVTLVSVVDGDTIRVKEKGKIFPVRLTGVDTPERRENAKAFRDADRSGNDLEAIYAAGNRAYQFTRGKLSDASELYLEFDVEARDRYGRALAYVFLPNGEMVNESILESGFAAPYTFPPNVRYVARFQEAARAARANRLGLWADGLLQMPEPRR